MANNTPDYSDLDTAAVLEARDRKHANAGFVYRDMSFWLNGVLSLCLVILGIAGNVALIGSLWYRIKQWLALYFYFFTFAVWNTALLLATVLFNCLPGLFDEYSSKWPSMRNVLEYTLYIGYLLGNTCMTAIVWLVVAVTIERYVAVTRPFHSRLSSPRKRAKIVSLAISTAALFYNVPLLFEFSVGSEMDLDAGSNRKSSGASQFFIHDTYSPRVSFLRENSYYILIYRVVCNVIFLYAIPFLVIVTLTIKIACTVSQSGQKRRLLKRPASNGIQETSHQVHLTLTFIVFKFLICYSLPVILNILELVLDEASTKSLAFAVTVDVSNFLVVGDSASNAFVYFSWRKRIRFYGLSLRKQSQFVVATQVTNAKKSRQDFLSFNIPNSSSTSHVDRIGCSSEPATRCTSTVISPSYRKHTSFL